MAMTTKMATTTRGTRRAPTKGVRRAHDRRQDAVPALVAGDLLDLIERSRGALAAAAATADVQERHAHAQIAALRAAAALLCQCAPRAVGSRPRSAWATISAAVPDLAEWAMFFEATGRRDRQARADLVELSAQEAYRLVEAAEGFLEVVLHHVGLPASVGALGGAELLPASAQG